MFRAWLASVFVVAAVAGCNEVETVAPPDAAPPPCNQGPFVFNEQGQRAQALPPESTTNTCPADNTNQPVIERLPRGGRYGVGWKVQYIGARDQQGDCNLETVCTCEVPDTTVPPPPPPADAGADAETDAAPPPPPPPPPTTPGVPTWRCQ